MHYVVTDNNVQAIVGNAINQNVLKIDSIEKKQTIKYSKISNVEVVRPSD